MTSGRHLVHESLHTEYVAALADKADKLPVGDPAAGPVALDLRIETGREFARPPGAEPAAGSGLSGSP
jgi:benzaldehyde dehydrogenase (NAD)